MNADNKKARFATLVRRSRQTGGVQFFIRVHLRASVAISLYRLADTESAHSTPEQAHGRR